MSQNSQTHFNNPATFRELMHWMVKVTRTTNSTDFIFDFEQTSQTHCDSSQDACKSLSACAWLFMTNDSNNS